MAETTEESKTMTMLSNQTVQMAQTQFGVPKASKGVYDLPCGYLDPSGILHTEVAVKEIGGHVEDMLGDKRTPPNKKINELLARCVERIGSYTDPGQLSQITLDLPIGDRAYLMFAIRMISLGNEYPFTDKCPSCGKEKIYIVDLAELAPRKMVDPHKRVHDVVLPSSGKSARFHVMTGRDEDRLSKINKDLGKGGKSSDDASLSLAILIRLDMLDGRPFDVRPINGQPAGLAEVQNLGLRDRNFLRDQFEDHEGGLDTETELECPECGHEFSREIDVSQRGFFYPSAMRKNSKRKSST